jgi:hypothetical protein
LATRCPNGHEIGDEGNFCPVCGARLAPLSEEEVEPSGHAMQAAAPSQPPSSSGIWGFLRSTWASFGWKAKTAAVTVSVIVGLGVLGAALGDSSGGEKAAFRDPQGFSCDSNEVKYGRCPADSYYGKTKKEVAQARALANSPTVTDSESYRCKALESKFGRCPGNPYFGMTRPAVRAKKEQEAKERREAARRAREAEARRNAWKNGYTEYTDGLAFKWDNSVCDSSYNNCWGMRVVTRDGCGSLYVELQIQDTAGNAVDWTNDTASALGPGQVALLDFPNLTDTGQTARIAEMTCY